MGGTPRRTCIIMYILFNIFNNVSRINPIKLVTVCIIIVYFQRPVTFNIIYLYLTVLVRVNYDDSEGSDILFFFQFTATYAMHVYSINCITALQHQALSNITEILFVEIIIKSAYKSSPGNFMMNISITIDNKKMHKFSANVLRFSSFVPAKAIESHGWFFLSAYPISNVIILP